MMFYTQSISQLYDENKNYFRRASSQRPRDQPIQPESEGFRKKIQHFSLL